MVAARNTPQLTQQPNQQQCAAPTQNFLTTNSTQQQLTTTTFPLSTANIQHLQHLALQQLHQPAGQQHQTAAQASQLQPSSPANTRQQQSATPVHQIAASIHHLQQMAMQQQHQVVGQQRQPPAQACQFQLSTPIDTQQQQSTNLAPPMSANIQYLQILATQQQHQSDVKQHQPTAQTPQQQASNSADSQQQQSQTTVLQTAASIQYSQQMMAQQQHKLLLAEVNQHQLAGKQHQLAGKQHQPAAHVTQPRASSAGVTQQQQFAIPAPPMSANIQYSQQIKAQQQHQLVGQQQQPTAQASQLRALSFADTQQQQPATHAPPIGGNRLTLQILAELNQHQLTGQQHQPAAQVSQLRGASFADTQQQQSDIPAPPMTANIQYTPQMDTQQHQMVVQQHQPAAQASQLRASSSVDTQQQQSPTTHLDRHAMREATAHFDGAPSLIRFDCHLRYQKIIERNELKK
ncbi:uncharacterized protein Dwil_GK19165 [Drosophila willistoni]|uniref:Uncharacterized protein n=1 Tax=Drosophila willistoni TaxID=7260 RepID=B4MI57_DROWI|nr:uncharacterized protein Dwil_GK19165 [Drosophila willistoni]